MSDASPADEETTAERINRNWLELLQELRVTQTGVQILTAFLLILPFQNRFERLTDYQEYVYYAALLCATGAIVLLITPTAAHRIRWRQADQEALLQMATRTAIAATVFMASAMTASVYLITDYLFGEPATAVVTALVAVAFILFWYGFPLWRRFKDLR